MSIIRHTRDFLRHFQAYHGYLSTLLGILSLKGVRCVIIWRTFKPFDLLCDVLSSLYRHNRHFQAYYHGYLSTLLGILSLKDRTMRN